MPLFLCTRRKLDTRAGEGPAGTTRLSPGLDFCVGPRALARNHSSPQPVVQLPRLQGAVVSQIILADPAHVVCTRHRARRRARHCSRRDRPLSRGLPLCGGPGRKAAVTVGRWHSQGVQAGVREGAAGCACGVRESVDGCARRGGGVRESRSGCQDLHCGPAREPGRQLASQAALAWVLTAGHQHVPAMSWSGTV